MNADNRILDPEKVDAGIVGACNVFDALDMTLVERFQAARSIAASAAAMLGPKIVELVETYSDSTDSDARDEA